MPHVWDYCILLLTAVGLEYCYVRWAAAAAGSRPLPTALYAAAVAYLGYTGFSGSLRLQHGVYVYCLGIAAGAYASAYLARAASRSHGSRRQPVQHTQRDCNPQCVLLGRDTPCVHCG